MTHKRWKIPDFHSISSIFKKDKIKTKFSIAKINGLSFRGGGNWVPPPTPPLPSRGSWSGTITRQVSLRSHAGVFPVPGPTLQLDYEKFN